MNLRQRNANHRRHLTSHFLVTIKLFRWQSGHFTPARVYLDFPTDRRLLIACGGPVILPAFSRDSEIGVGTAKMSSPSPHCYAHICHTGNNEAFT